MSRVSRILLAIGALAEIGSAFLMHTGNLPSAARGRVLKPLAVKELFWKRNYVDQLLLPERDIQVWLPPSYDKDHTARYPVLYCHDGQNLWEPEQSWTGWSWQLRESLEMLVAEQQIAEPIVVTIDNDSSELFPMVRRRHLEYSGETWLGERFLSFLCDELKPCIDREFRTLQSPEHTAAMGSSMGGLCAFQAVWQRPDVFGNCAALSPVFQAPLLADVMLNGRRLRELNPRLYIDIGGDSAGSRVPMFVWEEGVNAGYWWLDTQLQPGVEAMRQILDFHNVEHEFFFAEGSRHNERAWAQRLDKPLRALLGQDAPMAARPGAFRGVQGGVEKRESRGGENARREQAAQGTDRQNSAAAVRLQEEQSLGREALESGAAAAVAGSSGSGLESARGRDEASSRAVATRPDSRDSYS